MKYLLALLSISALFLSSCMKKEGAATASMEATMKMQDSIRNANIAGYMAVTNMMNSGKMDDMGKYISDSYVEHQMMPGQEPGIAGLKKMMTDMHTAFPDMKFSVNHITADSNMIWAHFTMTGTNTGSFMGMPATGKQINIEGADIIKLDANHKAIEHWGYMEGEKMMQQLGMAPPPATSPAEAMKGKSK